MNHELKCWPMLFKALITGRKTFEYRENDRNFQAGDTLYLREFDPYHEQDPYTGYRARVVVTEVFYDIPGLPDGYVIMQIKLFNYWHAKAASSQ